MRSTKKGRFRVLGEYILTLVIRDASFLPINIFFQNFPN